MISAHQLSSTNGTPAILTRLAFGALLIKQRLGLSYEETVDQIRKILIFSFFLTLPGIRANPI